MSLEILGSTVYVDLEVQEEPWYQLQVINMWDWSTKAVCYSQIGDTLISYCLRKNTPQTSKRYISEVVENLTDEMKEYLIQNKYLLK